MKELVVDVKGLDMLEAQVLSEYLTNGYNATKAYMAARPDVSRTWACSQAHDILERPHVSRALEDAKARMVRKIDKNSLVMKTERIIEKAEDKDMYGVALKGIELQGKLVQAFESGEADEEKYIQFITKISAKNVTVVNNLTEDNRKVEVHGSNP